MGKVVVLRKEGGTAEQIALFLVFSNEIFCWEFPWPLTPISIGNH